MLIKKTCGDVTEFKAARTLLGRPVYITHFFYLDGLLIDTGPRHNAREVFEALRNLPLEKVVITHQHEDHTGNCNMLSREMGVPVYAHPETIRVMSSPPDIEIYRKIMWGDSPPAEAFPLGQSVSAGPYTLQAIHTGGHSKDHVCYYEPSNGWLFSGDLYLGENLTGFMIGENIVEHLTSLQKLIALKPNLLFCGLKGRLDNGTERLKRKYDCWWDLCTRVTDLYEAGKSHREIFSKVFGREILFYYFSQSNWGRRYMLRSIINNIEYFKAAQKKESLSGFRQNL